MAPKVGGGAKAPQPTPCTGRSALVLLAYDPVHLFGFQTSTLPAKPTFASLLARGNVVFFGPILPTANRGSSRPRFSRKTKGSEPARRL